MRATLTIAALTLAAAGLPGPSPALAEQSALANAADTVRSCSGNHKLGDTEVYYGDLSVRNMTCALGRNLLRRATLSDNGTPRISGYRCRLIGTYPDGGIYRCTRKNRALRFQAGG